MPEGKYNSLENPIETKKKLNPFDFHIDVYFLSLSLESLIEWIDKKMMKDVNSYIE